MAAKKSNSARQFILSHPDKSAPEIVELAKAAGFSTVTTGYVHSARYSEKKAGAPKKKAETAARKRAAGKPGAKSAKGVSRIEARAAAAAAKLASKSSGEPTPGSAPAKRGPGRPRKDAVAPAKRGPGRPRKVVAQGGSAGPLLVAGSLENQFAALAVELGISRAEAILRRVREALERLTF